MIRTINLASILLLILISGLLRGYYEIFPQGDYHVISSLFEAWMRPKPLFSLNKKRCLVNLIP